VGFRRRYEGGHGYVVPEFMMLLKAKDREEAQPEGEDCYGKDS